MRQLFAAVVIAAESHTVATKANLPDLYHLGGVVKDHTEFGLE